MLFLATDCDSSGAAINADYTDLIDETKYRLAKEEIAKNETYSLDLRCRRDHKNAK